MSSRRLEDLHPSVVGRFVTWLRDCEVSGLDLLVTCVLRTRQEQALLYRTNRSVDEIMEGVARLQRLGLLSDAEVLRAAPPQPGASGSKRINAPPGPKLTNAPPGLSFHHDHSLHGCRGSFAVDFVPIEFGKPKWNDHLGFKKAGEKAEAYGLTWSGRWTKFKETCHVQWDDKGNIDIVELAKGGM